MRIYILSVCLFLFLISNLFSQTEKVNSLLKLVADGKIEEVKDQLLDLLAEYPNDPGVQLLHGVVIDDAFRAIEIYKRIIKEHPKSQWTENAYWRIIQFYAILGDVEQAKVYLEKFRQQFPSSDYLAPSSDIVNSAIRISKTGIKPAPESQTTNNPMITDDKQTLTKTNSSRDSINKSEKTQIQDKKSNSVFYGLQVGIFHDKESANAEMNKFLKQRMRTEVLEKVVGGEKLFAVVIGNYSSRESAEAAKQIVEQQCNCKPIIFEK
jgi:cell division septation protein DedD